MNSYTIMEICRSDNRLRTMFFDFTRRIYPNVDFVEWHARGFWQSEYVPHAVVQDDRIVANVSATRMRLVLSGREINGVQIGTVGTIPEFRGQGLSRLLMERIIDKYQDTSDILFLFANDDVLDFYTKFGFKRHHASIFTSDIRTRHSQFSARQLSIHSKPDMELLDSLLKNRMIITARFGAVDYSFITHWHVLNIFPNDLFYMEEEDVLLIAREYDGVLNVFDVICSKSPDLRRAIERIVKSPDTKSIVWHFPPDRLYFDVDHARPDDDCPMFVLGDFAVTDGEFKFPVTAQT